MDYATATILICLAQREMAAVASGKFYKYTIIIIIRLLLSCLTFCRRNLESRPFHISEEPKEINHGGTGDRNPDLPQITCKADALPRKLIN